MQNDRPVTSSYIAQCRRDMLALLEHYGLAGAVCVIDDQEWGYGYHLPATWNAFAEDASVEPTGLRIRATKSAELGDERANKLLTGTAHTLCSLKDFAHQTHVWMNDLLGMLRQRGIRVDHVPFGGEKLPRLTEQPPRA